VETLETLSRRIGTTLDLQSIVRTMKSLSAVSIHQYEQAIVALKDYSRTVELGLQIVLRQQPALVDEAYEGAPVACIIFGSDHGLCGRFNEQVVDFAVEKAGRYGNGTILWLTVGARVAARIEAKGEVIGRARFLPGSVDGLSAAAEDILVNIDEWRESEKVSRVFIFSNRRTEDATAAPRQTQLLPLDSEWIARLQSERWTGATLPAFTMERNELFSALVRQNLFVTIFRAGAESMASEHATRLAAMQSAERNIKDHLEEMRTQFRQRRQQAITEELLDVVAGFEVLRTSR
jgi:F-type H+-transporting ATPase subunit gamma